MKLCMRLFYFGAAIVTYMVLKALKASRQRRDEPLPRLDDFLRGQFHFGCHRPMHEEVMPFGACVDVEFKITACHSFAH